MFKEELKTAVDEQVVHRSRSLSLSLASAGEMILVPFLCATAANLLFCPPEPPSSLDVP